ncbi:MAG TPA: ATP-binding protein [Labilithrix sp.]
MTPDQLRDLKKIPLFSALDDALIVAVAEVGTSRDVAAGDVVFRQGDAGRELYVILAGAVRIHRCEHESELEIAVLQPGNYFGEISVIDGSPRSADATVVEAGRLFVVQREDYLTLLERFEPLLEDLLLRLARGIREGNAHRFGLVRETNTIREEAELERLRSLSEMVAGVAHEINTPLGVIQNAASLVSEMLTPAGIGALAKDDDAKETLRDCAEACALVQKNATHASRLVQSFKNLSVRQITDARETVDLLVAVSEALDLYRLKARSSNLELLAHSDLLASERIWDGFPGHLAQIVLNLVTNADRYAYPAERGGVVEVFLTAAELKKGVPGFELVVRDRGVGIPQKHLHEIWNPFFTTGRAKGGTGLGLAIVHNLVTSSLGGTIRVDSTEGKGTTFTLRLPRSVPEGAHRNG